MIALGDGFIAASALKGSQGSSTQARIMMEFDVVSRDGVFFGSSPGNDGLKAALNRHRGLLNMAFCDGHVEHGKIQKWYFSEDDQDRRRWHVNN